jgi:hypothetical protein
VPVVLREQHEVSFGEVEGLVAVGETWHEPL